MLRSENIYTRHVWRTVKGKCGMETNRKAAQEKAKATNEVAVVVPVPTPLNGRAPWANELGKTGVLSFCPFEAITDPFCWRHRAPAGYEPTIWNVAGGIEDDKIRGTRTPWYALKSTEDMDERANFYGESTGLVLPHTNRRVQAYALFMALCTLLDPKRKFESYEVTVIHFSDLDLFRLLVCRVFMGGIAQADKDAEKIVNIIYGKLVKYRVRLIYIPDFKKLSVMPAVKKERDASGKKIEPQQEVQEAQE